MGDITFEIIFIIVLLIANGLFSMSEMAVVSARKARLQKRASDGDRGAQAALELAGNPGTFLSTVEIGITLVGILAVAFGGATIAEKLAPPLKSFPAIEPYADKISFGLVVLVITYLSLVVGELIPKRLSLHSPEKIAAAVAAPMKNIAMVIDEHGGVEGLVTVNDILDALVGDIPSMDEQEEQAVVRREDGSFLLDGALPIDQLKQTLQLRRLPV